MKTATNPPTTSPIVPISISIINEVPEALHDRLQAFLTSRPEWDSDRLTTAALTFFLDVAAGIDAYPKPFPGVGVWK